MKKLKSTGIAIFDIDGVLCNIESVFCEKFGHANRNLYDFSKRYPDNELEISEFLTEPDSYRDAEPIFGGRVLLNQAIHHDWTIMLLTSRPQHLGKVTESWLDYYAIRYDSLWYVENKQEFIGNLPKSFPIFLVDDAIHHLNNLPKGVTGIAWEQPWNDGYFPRAKYEDTTMRVWKSFENGVYTPFWS